MSRRKLNFLQSNDEYLAEEHENTTHKDVESSDFQPLSCNDEEGPTYTDSDEEEDEDEHDETADNSQGNC